MYIHVRIQKEMRSKGYVKRTARENRQTAMSAAAAVRNLEEWRNKINIRRIME